VISWHEHYRTVQQFLVFLCVFWSCHTFSLEWSFLSCYACKLFSLSVSKHSLTFSGFFDVLCFAFMFVLCNKMFTYLLIDCVYRYMFKQVLWSTCCICTVTRLTPWLARKPPTCLPSCWPTNFMDRRSGFCSQNSFRRFSWTQCATRQKPAFTCLRVSNCRLSFHHVAIHEFTLWDHRYGLAHCTLCSLMPQFSLVLIVSSHGRMARLSWPG